MKSEQNKQKVDTANVFHIVLIAFFIIAFFCIFAIIFTDVYYYSNNVNDSYLVKITGLDDYTKIDSIFVLDEHLVLFTTGEATFSCNAENISDLRIWSRILSEEEIDRIYNNNKPLKWYEKLLNWVKNIFKINRG